MRIGIVSDNHALVDPALPSLLAGVDRIVHAGDLVTRDILPSLASIAPVEAVRGNNDVGPAFDYLPLERVLELDGVRILVRHVVGRPGRLDADAKRSITRAAPRIVIAGHSHRVLAEESDGVVYLNPGSCGPRRFRLPRTAGILDLSVDSIRFLAADLDTRGVVLDRRFSREAPIS